MLRCACAGVFALEFFLFFVGGGVALALRVVFVYVCVRLPCFSFLFGLPAASSGATGLLLWSAVVCGCRERGGGAVLCANGEWFAGASV